MEPIQLVFLFVFALCGALLGGKGLDTLYVGQRPWLGMFQLLSGLFLCGLGVFLGVM